jgi:hypothetical protein
MEDAELFQRKLEVAGVFEEWCAVTDGFTEGASIV